MKDLEKKKREIRGFVVGWGKKGGTAVEDIVRA